MNGIITMSNENIVNMTSVEVVNLINNFREEEGNTIKKEHKTLMRDIRNEIGALKEVGIINENNFVPVKYIDAKGEERPCYKMNKAGIMQMLNKESALVRYKTQQYIEALENKINQQHKPLTTMELLELEFKVIREQEKRIEDIENKMTVNYELAENLRSSISRRSIELLGGKDAEAYKKLNKKLFAAFYRDIKRTFRVNSYKNLSVKNYDAAMDYIQQWEPKDEVLIYAIQGLNSQLAFA